MKRARGVLVFVLVIVLLLSTPGATVFAQETVNDLGLSIPLAISVRKQR